MKISRLILLTLLFAFVRKHSQAQVTNPDTMVHKIFALLKNKDEKGFVALYPNSEQMTKLMGRMMSSLALELAKMDTTSKKQVNEEELDKMMIEQIKTKMTPERMTKEYDRMARGFRKVIEQGEKKGIDWNNIHMSTYTYDTATGRDKMMVKLFGEEEVKTMKGILEFTSSDSSYQVNFSEILFLPSEGGWYGGELKSLRRKGEKPESEWGEVLETRDIELSNISVESAPTPPPPPGKATKTKTKTSSTKSKTKTKS